ncbi:MAG: hypothetical protein C5B51_16955 [Terriglobia bacterium]|nr:MAG: hypothetical protein C5B51_16955 [Terriglobia bacterium]
MRRISSFWFYAFTAVAVLAGGSKTARAQDPDDLKRGVARISLVNGEASIQRGDSGEWVAAAVNAPVVTNDRISTGPNSRVEIEFDAGNALRIGGEAEVTMSQLEYGRYQMAVGRGTVTYRVLRNSNNDIEVDTPNVSVRPSRQGSYRIAVNDAGESEITSRSGEVEVFTPRGSQWVSTGQMMVARGTASDPEFQIVRAAPADEWDRWSDSRDRAVTASVSSQYVPPGVYGAEDLDPYGNWVNVPSYGYVWQPTATPGWAPYRNGRWVWVDWYGWTWVSYDPWGWAPYHYGRWFYEPAYGWCWYPGAIGVRHYWSPALVAFFGFGGGGVGVGFGNVGWVPLAPYEVLHPWWGRGYYGGPGYVNRNVNIVNVNITNVYRNARFANGYTAVSGADFRTGRFNNFLRPSNEDLRQASFARGPIPVAPDRANLRFSDRQAAFVPRNSGNSRVFSYRQPAPAPRIPFAEQRRGVEQMNGIPQNRGFGNAPVVREPAAAGGWQRFGEARTPQVAPRVEQAPQRMEQPAAPANRGWNRFGDPSGPQIERRPAMPREEIRNERRPVAPGYRFEDRGQPESLRIAPPVVRERPGGEEQARPSFGGRFGGPRMESRPEMRPPPPAGGGFGAPREMRAPERGNFGGGRAESRGAPSGGSGGDRGSRGNGGGGHGRGR